MLAIGIHCVENVHTNDVSTGKADNLKQISLSVYRDNPHCTVYSVRCPSKGQFLYKQRIPSKSYAAETFEPNAFYILRCGIVFPFIQLIQSNLNR